GQSSEKSQQQNPLVVIERLRMEGARQRLDPQVLLFALNVLQNAEVCGLRIAASWLRARLRIFRLRTIGLRIPDCGLRIARRRSDYRNPRAIGFCIAAWHVQIVSRECFEKKAITGFSNPQSAIVRVRISPAGDKGRCGSVPELRRPC